MLVIGLGIGLAATVLGIVVALHPAPTGPERAVDRALFAPRPTTAFAVFRIVTVAGSGAVVAVLGVGLAVLCWRWGRRSLAVVCVAGPALAAAVELLAKPIVGRVRPGTGALTGEGGFGFPSGHSAGATALAAAVILVAWRLCESRRLRDEITVGAVAYAFLVGVSRLVVGAHFALDVVGGWLLGIASVLLVATVVDRLGLDSAVLQTVNAEMEP